jgi:hypothetical protein
MPTSQSGQRNLGQNPSRTHLVSRIETENFGGKTLRIGDLDSDGAADLLISQSIYGMREITCLTALTINGRVLWQRGAPTLENGRVYSDLPVQVYDRDDDSEAVLKFNVEDDTTR